MDFRKIKIGASLYFGILTGLGGSYYCFNKAEIPFPEEVPAMVEHKRIVEKIDSLESRLKDFSLARKGSFEEYEGLREQLSNARSDSVSVAESREFREYYCSLGRSREWLGLGYLVGAGVPLLGFYGALRLSKPKK